MMNANEIRDKFLKFFESKGHLIVPSAPIVMKDDPTLMFMNSGMAQFKDYFLGNKKPPAPRIADTQKCLRVTGKHNDLEDVGHDTYHHTFFEMLGNWSFGDYFKKEAIEWAWELLTEVYGLPKERLYVTVFGGDAEEGLEADEEAKALWLRIVPEDRILYGSKKDNFWEMGDTGPCGPCSEIHIDLRDEAEIAQLPGRELVNKDHPLVIEIWNLVFMQYERMSDGSLRPLPAKHIDTGMGFERLCMVVQGKKSNYDTDLFQPIIKAVAQKAGVHYGDNSKTDVALRVIADHVRAITFTIADGQLPGSTGAGYVIRRILRRAVRYGYTFLGFQEPFLFELVDILANMFEDVFPEVKQQKDFVSNVIREEERSFLRTLDTGLKRLEQYFEAHAEKQVIDGKTAFELYDTFGFPIDLTALIARERGFRVDMEGFESEMQKQKERSRSATALETGDWVVLHSDNEVEFVGYDTLSCEAKLLKYRKVKEGKKTFYQLVFNRTPFYPEGGGQIGDRGVVRILGSDVQIPIVDTKKENDLIVHFTTDERWLSVDGLADKIFLLEVNKEKRLAAQRNHSATHLLHAALKKVLGDHVAQRGSLVSDEVLRFDFSHFSALTQEEIITIEKIVNEKIRENIALDERRSVPIQEALEMGATALFGEKYGEYVRVITFDENYSRELCGGTHVRATGEIGYFVIASESSVAAGVRRIEAYTGAKAVEYARRHIDLVQESKHMLKAKDLKKSIEQLISEKQSLSKEIERLKAEKVSAIKKTLLEKKQEVDGVNYIVDKVALPDGNALKQLAFELRNQVQNLVLILGAEVGEKAQLAIMLSDSLVKEKGWHAGNVVKEAAKEINGGGGGQPFFATAGGSKKEGLDRAIQKAKDLLK